jgi:hypothetical protein
MGTVCQKMVARRLAGAVQTLGVRALLSYRRSVPVATKE